MLISVTGTPGTGKTTLAKTIAKDLGFKYIDGNSIIEKYKLSEGIDKERDCKIVDVKKFVSSTRKECKESDNILDSHLSHHMPTKEVDICIVCRCNLKELKKRLVKRGYSPVKVRENLDAEIFETCLTEAREAGHEIIIYEQDIDSFKKALKKTITSLNKKKTSGVRSKK